MKNQFFGILYFLLVIGQMILCTYSQFTPYVVLSMLPAMILCMPLTVRTPLCMIIAFASGLAVDWLAEGLIGINAASLVPVALARKTIIRVFLGEDLIARNDSFTFKKNGFGKISIALFVALSIFFGIYVILDAAGTQPASFNLIRFAASVASSLILSLIVTSVLTPDDRK
jgi:hypothetical protein